MAILTGATHLHQGRRPRSWQRSLADKNTTSIKSSRWWTAGKKTKKNARKMRCLVSAHGLRCYFPRITAEPSQYIERICNIRRANGQCGVLEWQKSTHDVRSLPPRKNTQTRGENSSRAPSHLRPPTIPLCDPAKRNRRTYTSSSTYFQGTLRRGSQHFEFLLRFVPTNG